MASLTREQEVAAVCISNYCSDHHSENVVPMAVSAKLWLGSHCIHRPCSLLHHRSVHAGYSRADLSVSEDLRWLQQYLIFLCPMADTSRGRLRWAPDQRWRTGHILILVRFMYSLGLRLLRLNIAEKCLMSCVNFISTVWLYIFITSFCDSGAIKLVVFVSQPFNWLLSSTRSFTSSK